MRRSTVGKLVLLSLMAAACKEREPSPYYQPRNMRDASEPERGDSSMSGDAMNSDQGTGDLALPAYPGIGDNISKALTPVHTSKGCGDFTTGAAYGQLDVPVEGRRYSALAPHMTKGPECGYWEPDVRDNLSNMVIRRTDGKLFYLRAGYIYQFVPDPPPTSPAEGWALKNDLKLNVTSKCKKPLAVGGDYGPYDNLLLQPNGKFVFDCADGTGWHDQNGRHLGTWRSDLSWISFAVDNAGMMINLAERITVPDEKGQVQVVYDHGSRPKLKVISDAGVENCLDIGGKALAARPLTTGFLLVVRNACGLQLWRVKDATFEYLASYWKLEEPATELAPNHDFDGLVVLAVGGMLYFDKRLTISPERTTNCLGICALAPFVDGPTSPEPISVRTWDDADDWWLSPLGG